MRVNSLLALLGSSILSQLILVIFSPVLARLYTPDDFGIFGGIVSTISILSVIASFRLERALLIIPLLEDANLLFFALLAFVFVASSALFIILFLLLPYIVHISPNIPFSILFLLPSILFTFQTVALINHRLTRQKQLKRLALSNFLQSLFNTASQLFFGLIGLGPLGLSLGFLTGYSAAIIFNLVSLIQLWLSNRSSVSISRVATLLIKYIDFPKYTVPADLVNAVSLQAPNLFLLFSFSPSVSGSFLLAERLTKYPLMLVSNVITKFLFSHAIDFLGSRKLIVFYETLLRLLWISSIAIVIPFSFLIPSFFPFILGSQWSNAGNLALHLVPLYTSAFISIPIMSLLVILQKQRYDLVFQLTLLSSTICSFLVSSVFSFTSTQTIFIFSSLTGGCYLLGVFLSFHSLSVSPFSLVRILLVDSLIPLLTSSFFYIALFQAQHSNSRTILFVFAVIFLIASILINLARCRPLYAKIRLLT